MNQLSAQIAAPFETHAPVVMDCKLDKIFYGNFLAVRDSHVPIEKNKITGFIGPSGCGKSTVLRSLNRMNDLIKGFRFEGHVHFLGQDVYGKGVDPVVVRRYIGMVFQQPNPFSMSIFDNVAFGLRLNRYKGDLGDRVKHALQGVLHAVAQVALVAIEAQAERDVVENAHRERVGLLEHHADVTAHHHRVDALAVDILAEEVHMALETEALDQVVHAVEAAQHGALAATGRADEAGDLVLLDRHMAVAHGQEVAVENLVQLAVHDHGGVGLERGGYLCR